MNKKFLKSLTALFAVVVLGVSCSSNTNPENEKKEETQVTTITDKQIEDALKAAFGDSDVDLNTQQNTKANFSKGKYSSAIYLVSSTKGSNEPSKEKLDTLVKTTKKSNIISELEKIGVVVDKSSIDGFASKNKTSDDTTAEGSFNITIKENYKLENITTKITIAVKITGANWGA